MLRENINDLIALAPVTPVAEERSFAKAAARLNLSQSALRHTIKGLETRLGLRLLPRHPRSVAPTAEGKDLLATLNSRFGRIESRLAALADSRDTPSGTVRIVAADYPIDTILWPKLAPVRKAHPLINAEFLTDYGYADLAAARCDAGVRYGDQVSDGMISTRIGPDERMICVGAPELFAQHGASATPHDLSRHRRVNLRLSTHGALYAWEFEDPSGQEIRVKVEGQACVSTIMGVMGAALDGAGLALVPERLAQEHLQSGRLQACLLDWRPCFPGLHFYYPSRQRPSSAFQVAADALRERG